MSEIFLTKFLHKSENNSGAMDSTFRFYMWIKYTALMLFLQIIWKIRQITDYFNVRSESIDNELSSYTCMVPLTKESKKRRHIRSMSDVQSSTPHRTHKCYRKFSYHPFFDAERPRRLRSYQYPRSYRYIRSSDSSDYSDNNSPKTRRMEINIVKPKDSMRFL